MTKEQKEPLEPMPEIDPDTADVYGKVYFQGGKSASNYSDYIKDALGPSRILAEMLYRTLHPSTALDVGCAVGHTVKRLRDYGVEGYGIDISDWAVAEANAP
jgi:predicted TPR repeat methyltransferase